MLVCGKVTHQLAQNKECRWGDNRRRECLRAEDRLEETPVALMQDFFR